MKTGTSSKIVLITGGSSGIGKSIGEFLSEKNYKVYGTSRKPANIPGSSFELVPLDVTKKEIIISAIGYILQIEGRIDVLINTAVVGITGRIVETTEEEIKKAYDII